MAGFYLSIFKNSRVIDVSRSGGHVVAVTFELDGQRFIGLNAGPHDQFNEAISFFISCETEEDIDYYWEKLRPAARNTAKPSLASSLRP
jgi:predicted 3-demethylubiquinone-9 3-methyltransferase (glyoxalase superfamily)